jgi:hypothetical protein
MVDNFRGRLLVGPQMLALDQTTWRGQTLFLNAGDSNSKKSIGPIIIRLQSPVACIINILRS